MYVNVMDTGAVAGGTTDCTDAFNKAAEKARTEGKIVYVPGFRFFIKGNLVGFSDVIVEGVSCNKQYNNKFTNQTLFEGSSSVLIGNGTNSVFGWHSGDSRAYFEGICFTGFKNLAEATDNSGFSPRWFCFDRCSFQGMRVLNAPGTIENAIHNFRFYSCDFTNHGYTSFYGRIIDMIVDGCTFVGGTPVVMEQARANIFTNNRFEWIDNGFAIQLTDCAHITFEGGLYDRMAGAAFQLKEKNSHIRICDALFNRCGSLIKSDGTDLKYEDGRPYGEGFRCFIRLFDFNDDIQIVDNTFGIEKSTDRGTRWIMTPDYVVTLMYHNGGTNPDSVPIKLVWKGNTVHNASIKKWLFSETGVYDNKRIQVETDDSFGELNEQVVSLATHATHRIYVRNRKDVSVSSIPDMMEVENSANINTPKQLGHVFGGTVNNVIRYRRPEVVHEYSTVHNVVGSAAWKYVDVEIPVPKPVKGAPVTVSMAYSGTPDVAGVVKLFDESGNDIVLPNLPVLNGTRRLYEAVFNVPSTYAGNTYKLRVYATQGTSGTTSTKLDVLAVSVTYGFGASAIVCNRA